MTELFCKLLNEDFISHLTSVEEELHVTGKLELPLFDKKTPHPHAAYHQALREFIRAHKSEDIFDYFLYEAVESISLLTMLLEEGVRPAELKDAPENTPYDPQALTWVALISLRSDFPINPHFCKMILDQYTIDKHGLSYLLWLLDQSSYPPLQKKEVRDLLISFGATSDSRIVSEYPVFR